MADQNLNFKILNQIIGADKVDELRGKFLNLGKGIDELDSKLIKLTSATYLFSKARELAASGLQSFKEVVDMADDLEDMAEKTGIAAETLTQFQGAAKQSGLTVQELEKALKKFTSNLGDVNNDKFLDAMKVLGVNTKDTHGELKTADVALKELSDRFSQMQDGPQKAAAAVAIFGKQGADLIPLLNMGSKEIENMGFKMASEFPGRAKRFNDSLEDTKKITQQTQAAFLNDLLPSLQTVVDSFNSIEKQRSANGGGLGADFGSAAKVIADIMYSMTKGLTIIGDLAVTIVADVGQFIRDFLGAITIALSKVTQAIISFGKGNFDAFKNFDSGFGAAFQQNALDRRARFSNFAERALQRGQDAVDFDRLVSNGFQKPQDAKRTTGGAAPQEASKLYEKEIDAVKKFRESQLSAIRLEELQTESYKYSAAELKKKTIAEQIHSQAVRETIGFQTSAKEAYMKASEEIIAQRQHLVDVEEQNKRTSVEKKPTAKDAETAESAET